MAALALSASPSSPRQNHLLAALHTAEYERLLREKGLPVPEAAEHASPATLVDGAVGTERDAVAGLAAVGTRRARR